MRTPSPEQPSRPEPDSVPLNRAARRGQARKTAAAVAADRAAGRRAQPVQGRRINPIRRTG
jgi:hypothetical protein